MTKYPSQTDKPTGVDVAMYYGDSSTGSFAKGPIGLDTATIAGIAIADQAFGVINDTNNPVVQYNTAGIVGLGFPAGR